MICDIVQLPRRLAKLRRPEATITSEQVVGFPTSGIYRTFGYWDYDDDTVVGVGSQHRVITGKDALFRYKFIEPMKYGLAEYFVMATSPIDIRFPLHNKNIKLYCPWVTITDTKTLKFRKFILWANIFELTHYETEDTVYDAPIEAVIANEIRNFAERTDRPDLMQDLHSYPKNWKDVLISEERLSSSEATEALMQIGSNIRSYNEMMVDTEPYYWCDPSDIFRGVNLPTVWTDTSILKSCTLLPHFLYGSTTIGQLKHLFGMTYDTHAFQRVFNTNDLHPYTEISIYDENPDLFGILSNVCRIRYGEFKLDIVNDVNIHVYNAYDPFLVMNQQNNIQVDSSLLQTIKDGFFKYAQNFQRAEVIRSWAEETYFTIFRNNGKVDRFYFDLVSSALGTRSLIKDYQGHLF